MPGAPLRAGFGPLPLPEAYRLQQGAVLSAWLLEQAATIEGVRRRAKWRRYSECSIFPARPRLPSRTQRSPELAVP
jgi:hypothetical protein